MSQLRNAIISNFTLIRTLKPNNGLPFFLRESAKLFSTEATPPPPPDGSSPDPFFQASGTGLVYGRLTGNWRYTMRTDVMNLLEDCNLTLDDIKVSYNRGFMPDGMMVQFPSRQAYDSATRAIVKKGRLYKLERANRSEWDILMPYGGKTVLLQGIPRNPLMEDVERFLSGCEYEPSSIQIIRSAFVLVRFPSRTEAMNAFIKKNRGFFLNNQISVRVLE